MGGVLPREPEIRLALAIVQRACWDLRGTDQEAIADSMDFLLDLWNPESLWAKILFKYRLRVESLMEGWLADAPASYKLKLRRRGVL